MWICGYVDMYMYMYVYVYILRCCKPDQHLDDGLLHEMWAPDTLLQISSVCHSDLTLQCFIKQCFIQQCFIKHCFIKHCVTLT